MTDQATRVVPAGWYEDPASPAHVRWWNGLAWTEHTAIKPTQPQPTASGYAQQGTAQQGYAQQGTTQQAFGRQQPGAQGTTNPVTADQVTTSTGSQYTAETAARIAEARELERQYGISTAEHDIIVRRAAEGAHDPEVGSTAQAWSGREPYDDEPYDEEPGTGTASAWFIALWPVLTLVALAAAGYVAYFITPEPAVAGIPLVYAAVLLPSLLTLVWAATDARKLRALGHPAPSPAFALLGPLVYLIARRAKVAGVGPLLTLLVLTLLAVGAPVAALATGSADRVTLALEVQQSVREEYVDGGDLTSVTCPIFLDTVAVGAIYSCEGTTPEGTSRLVWVSIDDADGAFSTALAVR